MLLTWVGGAALSGFRLARLHGEVQALHPRISALAAHHVHFLVFDAPPGDRALAMLRALFEPVSEPAGMVTQQALWVIPRSGTISPWSSKAADIVGLCGVDGLRRVERGVCYRLAVDEPLEAAQIALIAPLLHDRMTQSLLTRPVVRADIDVGHVAARLRHVPLGEDGSTALRAADRELGLALSDEEIDYLVAHYRQLGRDPTDAELMMFAQANSEHCRHKIFNADWVIDGVPQPNSLFAKIRSTHAASPDGVLSAYRDNAAVIAGSTTGHLVVDPGSGRYVMAQTPLHTLMKVETHNHPTAISPFPGAATGSGGEIRDEGATGRGGRPKAGLTGFSVSHLQLPGWRQPWERSLGRPARIASALQIMLEGPIGAASFNNEFGRPNIAGYFRTFEVPVGDGVVRGYHKPIMVAGGLGNVSGDDVDKADVPAGALLVVLGGPAMLIGLGGGAASSVGSGASSESLDYASVQRGNPEMQRRAQQVIDAARALSITAERPNPLLIIHDVGAGGLSNAIPELVDHSKRGAKLDLRAIPSAEPGLSPLEIWCNEAQERYVVAIAPADLAWFGDMCARERCPWAVLGALDDTGCLVVEDPLYGQRPVDMPLDMLLGKPPRTVRRLTRRQRPRPADLTADIDIAAACEAVLRMPVVADKSFLIHIGDRTVGGLVARDQLVGPWQVPVSDVAVTALGFDTFRGEAMAMGERAPVALLDAPASGRLAVAEALTNIAAADIGALSDVRLSANWMAACGHPGEDEALHDTVDAVAALCRELRIAIPVGKDSLSMQTRWQDAGEERTVVAPLSLVVSAFAPVGDIRRTLTPMLSRDLDTRLLLIDLGAGRNALGGSVLAQAFAVEAGPPADLDDGARLAAFFALVRVLRAEGLLLAYHDRGDGGLWATLCEMAFAGRVGLDIAVDGGTDHEVLAALFSEAPGAVVQVAAAQVARVMHLAEEYGLAEWTRVVAQVTGDDAVRVEARGRTVYEGSRTGLHRHWSELSFRMRTLRDNPEVAQEAWDALLDADDPGLRPLLTFDLNERPAARRSAHGIRPRLAILREQGVNSQMEMAAAFATAGFDVIDVHMSDLHAGRQRLDGFAGLAVCGGFSFGDVLGAGGGWAKSILHHARLREEFAAFFARGNTFTLGVCNGCQMLSRLAPLIPGADHWPRFATNRSEQFEAHLSLVEVLPSPSILLDGMAGSRLLIATSHGEGRAVFDSPATQADCLSGRRVALRYVDNHGRPALRYPANPNGSPEGIAGLCSADGRVTILMPHPERVVRSVQHAWSPPGWGDDGPWRRLFDNARVFAG